MRNKKQEKDKKLEKQKVGKKGKDGPKGYLPPEMDPKSCFFTSELSREIVTKLRPKKKSDFEHPTKTKKMKENENERK